jgi:hypothetical protein
MVSPSPVGPREGTVDDGTRTPISDSHTANSQQSQEEPGPEGASSPSPTQPAASSPRPEGREIPPGASTQGSSGDDILQPLVLNNCHVTITIYEHAHTNPSDPESATQTRAEGITRRVRIIPWATAEGPTRSSRRRTVRVMPRPSNRRPASPSTPHRSSHGLELPPLRPVPPRAPSPPLARTLSSGVSSHDFDSASLFCDDSSVEGDRDIDGVYMRRGRSRPGFDIPRRQGFWDRWDGRYPTEPVVRCPRPRSGVDVVSEDRKAH